MLVKINFNPAQLKASSAEELADILFEIGKSQSRRSRWSEAIHWLEKAHEAIAGRELLLSRDAAELSISIMHAMARALIHRGDEESRAKAWGLIHRLDVECGNKLFVSLLKLDAFAIDPVQDQDYCDVLQTVVDTVHLTDINIKTILHHAHKLRRRSPSMTHTILARLLLHRLLGAEKRAWLEKAFVSIIWNSTAPTGGSEIQISLADLLTTLETSSVRALSPSAIHAAQIVRLSWDVKYMLMKQALVEAHRNQL